MDVNGVGRPKITSGLDIRNAREAATSGSVKPESSTDRDGNGRQPDAEPEKRKLTDAEMQLALDHLRNLPGLKANNLTVEVEIQNEIRIVKILDADGRLVRRIPESDLWELTKDRKKTTGQILDSRI